MADESQVRQPVQEFTQFIEKPTVTQPTQYQTQYVHQHVQEAPIKVKEQPIQMVEQFAVVKEQPVIHRHQEVQVQQEQPITIIKRTVGHETLPPVEEKEMVVQPLRPADTNLKTVQTTSGETTVQVSAPSQNASAIKNTLDERTVKSSSSTAHGLVEKVEETIGGVKQAGHAALEKARDIFHQTPSSSAGTSHPS